MTGADVIGEALRLIGVVPYGPPVPAQFAQFERQFYHDLEILSAEWGLLMPASPWVEFAAPPGHLKALIYNLAVRLAPQFGKISSALLEVTAEESKRCLRGFHSKIGDTLNIRRPARFCQEPLYAPSPLELGAIALLREARAYYAARLEGLLLVPANVDGDRPGNRGSADRQVIRRVVEVFARQPDPYAASGR